MFNYKENIIFSSTMLPHFHKDDLTIFYKYLDKATIYFEFGSGGTTVQAAERRNITKLYSVENIPAWYLKLLTTIIPNKVTFLYAEMDIKSKSRDYPGPKSTYSDWIKYSRAIANLDTEAANNIDLFLINGRFRVACLLNCFSVMNDNAVVLFDDFQKRKQYHIVLDYFSIIEHGINMVVLKKKSVVGPPIQIIRKYESIHD
jgi:hypothetical protein